MDDGVARRRDLRPACGTRPVDYRRTVVGGGDDQAAQLTAVRRGVCRDDGAEHPTLARAAVPLHDAACWYGDRLLRSDGFIGLAMPHVTRMLFRNSDHRVLVPGTVLSGAAVLLLCDLVSKMFTLPINAITALLGIPIVVWVVLRNKSVTA